MNKLIDKLPTWPIIIIGGWMAFAPVFPEPHLVQKFLWAMNGETFKLIDAFDVLMHGGLGLLAVMKVWRELSRRPAIETS